MTKLPAQMHNDVMVARAELEALKRKTLITRILQDAEVDAFKNEIPLQVKTWRTTFHALEIPVVIWARNFQILDYNKTFTEICGYGMMIFFFSFSFPLSTDSH